MQPPALSRWGSGSSLVHPVKEHAILRVLVVDDFAQWRVFVSSLIQEKTDWQIVGEASDGPEGVRKAEELKPDLILLDIGLSKLNGIEAARQIRKLAPSSKILFLSVFDTPDIVRSALSTGANGYVLKADAGSDLVSAVEAVIRGKWFVSSRIEGCFFTGG
jgi:DNA-binding NarL/FixJ family response regulator